MPCSVRGDGDVGMSLFLGVGGVLQQVGLSQAEDQSSPWITSVCWGREGLCVRSMGGVAVHILPPFPRYGLKRVSMRSFVIFLRVIVPLLAEWEGLTSAPDSGELAYRF